VDHFSLKQQALLEMSAHPLSHSPETMAQTDPVSIHQSQFHPLFGVSLMSVLGLQYIPQVLASPNAGTRENLHWLLLSYYSHCCSGH
jgi:hypothetical protein